MNTSKRVVLFVSVSSEEQAAEGRASIPDQLARQRARAEANGWQVVDTIVIDGFSRRFFTYLEFAQAAAAAGIPDAMRMYKHWNDRDFDILSCRDLSRIGREQSILAEFVSRTIAAGAVVMPLDEATLDPTNYRMIAAIGGVGASQHIDNLLRYREMGMQQRARMGMRIGTTPPACFEAVYNERHEEIGIRPNRIRYQRFFDDLVTVFCDMRETYDNMGRILYEQFGHVNEHGKMWEKHQLQAFLYSPATWGHLAWGVRRAATRGGNLKFRYWSTGDEPAPAGVQFHRDVVEPVWPPAIAARVKAELRIRYYVYNGKANARNSFMFSSLIVCPQCHNTFSAQNRSDVGYIYYRCGTRYGGYATGTCDNAGAIREETVIDWLTPKLERLYAHKIDFKPVVETPVIDSRAILLQRDIDALQAELDTLANRLAIVPDAMLPAIQRAAAERAERLAILQTELTNTTQTAAASQQEAYARADAVNELAAVPDIRAFWLQEPRVINAWFHRYLGSARLVVEGGEIVGIT